MSMFIICIIYIYAYRCTLVHKQSLPKMTTCNLYTDVPFWDPFRFDKSTQGPSISVTFSIYTSVPREGTWLETWDDPCSMVAWLLLLGPRQMGSHGIGYYML